jgi:hypothetical protein
VTRARDLRQLVALELGGRAQAVDVLVAGGAPLPHPLLNVADERPQPQRTTLSRTSARTGSASHSPLLRLRFSHT